MDLSFQTEAIRPQLIERWSSILDTNDFSSGHETTAFEKDWAAYVGARHAIGCSDGTMALVLALRGAGISPGDEVITAPTSYFATAEAIALSGARPVFADVDAASGNLDPQSVAAVVSPRTRSILAVHLGGQPARMEELGQIASERHLLLLEDAAQAHGALYKGRRTGSLGKAAGFSFYPTKNLGALGEAGAVTTSDDALADRVRALRDHGQSGRHRHEDVGYNARLDSLQAAALRLKLRHLDAWNSERRHLAALYQARLEGLPLGLPPEDGGSIPVYHLFTIRTPERDALVRFLAQRGIATSSHYPVPIHLQQAFSSLGHAPGDFPAAERYAAEQISLPLYPGLTHDSLEEVAAATRSFFGG
jgi:dTDP-4-amino-4,6-dideoxygalactose transaminase